MVVEVKSPGQLGSRRLAIGLAVFLVFVTGLGYWLGRQRAVSAAVATGGLVVDEGELHFGEVWEQEEFEWEFSVKNTTNRNITISNWEVGCTCTSVETESLLIPPGGFQSVRLRVDLRPRNAADAAAAEWDFSTSATAHVKDSPSSEYRWVFSGRIRKLLAPESAPLDLGEVLAHKVSDEPIVRDLVLIRPISNPDIGCHSGDVQVKLLSTDEEDMRLHLAIMLSPTLPVGPFQVELTLAGQDPETGEELPPTGILARGQVVTDVYATPSRLAFGFVERGCSESEVVHLRSRTEQRFRILSINARIQGEDKSEEESSIFRMEEEAASSGAESQSYRVWASPVLPRPQWGTFWIEIEEDEIGTYKVPVIVSCTGKAPAQDREEEGLDENAQN